MRQMNGEERRKKMLAMLSDSKSPISGTALAHKLHVSRQVIVQDIALLRANGEEILSASRGYLMMHKEHEISRVFKMLHADAETEEELTMIRNGMIQQTAYSVIKV